MFSKQYHSLKCRERLESGQYGILGQRSGPPLIGINCCILVNLWFGPNLRMSRIHFFSVCYISSPINIKKLQAEHGLSIEFLKTLELQAIFSDREALMGRDYSVQGENKGMIMMLE